MKIKHLLCFLLLFVGTIGYSQYNYEIQLESFNDKQPKEVLDDFSRYIEVISKHFNDGIFFFQSNVLYTEENFNEIAAVTGYNIQEFKITSQNEVDHEIKE